ncbi:MAG: bacterial transcriptional activator domain-containing protein [Candidatus Cybelea sp.]
MTAPTLSVRCLGSFEYRGDGTWQSGPAFKHGREFLEYMTAYPRAPASYELLADAFWPACEVGSVRHRLHMAATGARAALRRVLPAVDAIRVLASAYAWDPRVRVESDYQQLLAYCDDGTVQAMKRGVALYLGEFCSGERAEWMYALRARAAVAYITMLQALAEDALARVDNAGALRYALQLIEADRGHEGATRLAMRAFAGMGCRGAALEKYDALQRWLRLHLGVLPGVDTRALRDEVAGEA